MSTAKENVIREKRTIEATKKNMMGPSGKMGVILQAFGSPVIRQGSGMHDVNYLDDPFADYVHTDYASTLSDQNGPVAQRDEMLMMEGDWVFAEGAVFDGLSRGMHFEIKQDFQDNEIIAYYKGYLVYREVAGVLDSYAPFPEWEDMVEKLYRSAKDKIKKSKKFEEEEVARAVDERKRTFWEQLRMRWGI